MNAYKMRIRDIAMLSLLILVSVSTAVTGEVPQVDSVKAPALQGELLARVERDQEARRAGIDWGAEHGDNGIVNKESLTDEERSVYDSIWAEVVRIDRDNTKWLKDIVSKRGWLTYSDVGIDGGDDKQESFLQQATV